jgi:hypothetical protein
LTGAVKHFLETSSQGQEVRERFLTEWQTVMIELDQAAEISSQPGWLRTTLGSFFATVFNLKAPELPSLGEKSGSGDRKKKPRARSQAGTVKFKGV